jgi:hypothetical protein
VAEHLNGVGKRAWHVHAVVRAFDREHMPGQPAGQRAIPGRIGGPPTSRNGAVVLSSAATTHGTVSNGVSQTAGSDRSAANAAAFVPNDFAINNGAPPIASSRGVISFCTHASTSGSNGFGGSSDQEYLCTVAPRRSATSPQYINKGAAGPYNRPGITTASATSATLRQRVQNRRPRCDPHARVSLVIRTVDLFGLDRPDLPG